ncbi:MAG: DUF3426 domain-containing protein [Burkholderiaceae bacterium]|nr:DUF3426 domain-containing protein [Burkholderiaceae bacterium]
MALATTCPQCKTSFRVVPDQLKLRRGFVRCGRCHNVFAGIDHLRYVDDAQLRRASGVDPRPRAAEAAEAELGFDAEAEHGLDVEAQQGFDTVAESGFDADAEAEHDSHDPLLAGYRDLRRDRATNEAEWIDVGPPALETFADGTLTDEAFTDEARSDEAPVAETVVEDEIPADPHFVNRVAGDAGLVDYDGDVDLVAREATREDALPPYVERYTGSPHEDDGADAESAIDYFSTRRARGFADRRGLASAALAIALAIALVLQWAVAERSAIAVRVPGVAPLLGAALAPFGLHIEAPHELDALTIESFELQASAAADVLELRALLRNRADHPVRWPSMQLTLTDPENRVLVRRALHPDDYLAEAGAVRTAGVPAHTEWPLRLALEASDLRAAGYDYRVQLFYP